MKQVKTDIVERARAYCVKNKLNLTQPRADVLAAVTTFSTPATAYDIVDAMDDTKPMTVYRALEFLTKHGFVHRVESLNAYLACEEHHCKHTDSQYLVCGTCKNVEELHNHKLDNLINEALQAQGFAVQQKTIEIHGTCKGCQGL